ncbi:MAG: hypothetical protein J6R90_02995 [Alistipes sp.]|nr:hypothetical protein [Alistipes sp.]
MDIVITYVNGLDPVWQAEYERHTNTPILEKRFRDWGTLKYLFRGIERNMPFIRKVHLVVSGESQVPEWINREEVNIVLHRDIIPVDHLPTFCSNTIELHMHRIEGLDEEFLYFNDDIFPMLPCQPTDFFRDGKGIIGMSRHWFAPDMFKKICRNSDRAARKALGMRAPLHFLRPQHICAPMLRSECQRVYGILESDILASLTATRTERNITQYLFTDFLYLQGRIIARRQPRRHFSVGIASVEKVAEYLLNPDRKLVCINDVKLSEERYEKMRTALHSSFKKVFPEKSKYEI